MNKTNKKEVFLRSGIIGMIMGRGMDKWKSGSNNK